MKYSCYWPKRGYFTWPFNRSHEKRAANNVWDCLPQVPVKSWKWLVRCDANGFSLPPCSSDCQIIVQSCVGLPIEEMECAVPPGTETYCYGGDHSSIQTSSTLGSGPDSNTNAGDFLNTRRSKLFSGEPIKCWCDCWKCVGFSGTCSLHCRSCCDYCCQKKGNSVVKKVLIVEANTA